MRFTFVWTLLLGIIGGSAVFAEEIEISRFEYITRAKKGPDQIVQRKLMEIADVPENVYSIELLVPSEHDNVVLRAMSEKSKLIHSLPKEQIINLYVGGQQHRWAAYAKATIQDGKVKTSSGTSFGQARVFPPAYDFVQGLDVFLAQFRSFVLRPLVKKITLKKIEGNAFATDAEIASLRRLLKELENPLSTSKKFWSQNLANLRSFPQVQVCTNHFELETFFQSEAWTGAGNSRLHESDITVDEALAEIDELIQKFESLVKIFNKMEKSIGLTESESKFLKRSKFAINFLQQARHHASKDGPIIENALLKFRSLPGCAEKTARDPKLTNNQHMKKFDRSWVKEAVGKFDGSEASKKADELLEEVKWEASVAQ